MTKQRRKTILLFSIGFFIILATIIILYSYGYSINSDFSVSQKGGLYISTPYSDPQIFINNKTKRSSGVLNRGLFSSNIKIGKYSVLVAKDGYWPWAKNLEVKKGLVSEAKALLIPENPKGEILFKGKISKVWASPHNKILALEEQKNNGYRLIFYLPEKDTFLTAKNSFTEKLLVYTKISNFIWEENSLIVKNGFTATKIYFDLSDETVVATYFKEELDKKSDFEKLDKRKEIKIWWENQTNEVFVDWLEEDKAPPYYICDNTIPGEKPACLLPIQIFKSPLEITSLDFFPKRKDVVILAVGNGVYALEIDDRNERLAYPIYKGKKPHSSVFNTDDKVYIVDDGSLIKIDLEQ